MDERLLIGTTNNIKANGKKVLRLRRLSNFRSALSIFIVIAIVASYVFVAVSSVRQLSATNDETWHVISGLTFLRMGDLRANTDHPYPPNALAALPLALNKNFKFLSWNDIRYRTAQPGLISEKVAKVNGGVLHHGRYVLTTAQLFWPRTIMIASTALFLLVFGLLLRKYFGWRVGVLATILLGFSPAILAHGSLATTDMPVTAMIFLSSFVLWLAYRAKTTGSFIILLTIFLDLSFLALMSKYTALVVAPFWLILAGYAVFARNFTRRFFLRVLISIAVSLGIFAFWFFTLYAAYDFKVMTLQQTKFENKDSIREEKELLKNNVGPKAVELYERIPLPFPYYIRGVLFNMIFKDVLGHESFFLGKYENVGPLYYLVAFLVKETIPFAIASAVFIFWSLSKIGLLKKNKDLLFLWIPPTVIALLFSFSNVKIGIRHILPIYPFLALGSAILMNRLLKNNIGRVVVCVGIFSVFITSFNVYPNYLSYFNLFAGGSANGYRWIQDSNYDWGQNEFQAKQLIKNSDKEVSYEDKEQPKPGKYYLLRLSEIYDRPRNLDQREISLRELLEQGKLQIIKKTIPTHWLVYYP
ncbi:MAG: hypothetical protein WC269_06790 [Candidatus Gracilibacteria bacterium]|jgi:hypothetical protein